MYFGSVEEYFKRVENKVQARVKALAKYKKKEKRRREKSGK